MRQKFNNPKLVVSSAIFYLPTLFPARFCSSPRKQDIFSKASQLASLQAEGSSKYQKFFC